MLTDTERQTIEAYDRIAAEWAASHSIVDYNKTHVARLKEFLPSGKVLDIGCGAGRDLLTLQKAGYDVSGIEPSDGLRQMAKAALSGVEIRSGSLYDLPLEPERLYDGLWCFAVLLHVPKKRLSDALARLYVSLKPGGIGGVAVKEGSGEESGEDGRHWSFYGTEEISHAFEQNGFEILDAYTERASKKTNWIFLFVRRT